MMIRPDLVLIIGNFGNMKEYFFDADISHHPRPRRYVVYNGQ